MQEWTVSMSGREKEEEGGRGEEVVGRKVRVVRSPASPWFIR